MKKIVIAAALVAVSASAALAMSDEKLTKMVDEKMSSMDTNKDGKISMEEHRVAADKMFRDADTNGDKMLTREELMAYKKSEMSKYDSSGMEGSDKTK